MPFPNRKHWSFKSVWTNLIVGKSKATTAKSVALKLTYELWKGKEWYQYDHLLYVSISAPKRSIFSLYISFTSFNFLARHKFSYGQYQPYFKNHIVLLILLILLGNAHIDIEQGVTILIITGYHQISFALH